MKVTGFIFVNLAVTLLVSGIGGQDEPGRIKQSPADLITFQARSTPDVTPSGSTSNAPSDSRDGPAPALAKSESKTASLIASLSVEEARKATIARCLAIYFTKQVDAEKLRPWSIMHGLIAYGRSSQIIVNGEHVSAADYLCANGIGNEMRILYLENGKLRTRIGPGVQGHPGQLLAILAQSNIPSDHQITVDGKTFTVQDLIEFEKRDCRSNTELTFKLIGLSHYLEPDATWTNDRGEVWNFSRLIREELQQPIHNGACGGTHRLMGFSFAVFQMEKRGLKLAGEWLGAARMIEGYAQRAFDTQNADGSFSTDFFEGSGADPDVTLRLYTTGHILEWLVFTLPTDRMHDPKIVAAVDYLTNLMLSAPGYEMDTGPRGHAIHALGMYELKTYGQSSEFFDRSVAERAIEFERLAGRAFPARIAESNASSSERSNNDANRRPAKPGLFRRR